LAQAQPLLHSCCPQPKDVDKMRVLEVLVVLPSLAAGLALVDGNAKLGQTLARSIAKSLQGEARSDTLQQGLMETLNSKQEVLTSPEIAKAVEFGNSLAEHHMPEDSFCARDWSDACPDGWDHSGESCLAPKSYKGGCGTLQNFGSASFAAKKAFADTCKAPWPCSESKGSCPDGIDYERCPVGFEQLGAGLCQLSNEASSTCASLYNFGDMDIAQKQALAKDCGMSWACKVGSTPPPVAATLPTLPDGPIVSNSASGESQASGLPEEWFVLPSGPVDSQGGIRF